jgi:Flp pilus assembly protein TadD
LVVRNRFWPSGVRAFCRRDELSARADKIAKCFYKNEIASRFPARSKSLNQKNMRPRFLILLLVLITLAVFLPVVQCNFLDYDDNDYVTDNPFVKNGLTWPDLRWAFTTFHASNWHPLTWLSHALDCQLFGAHAGAQHYVNVIFHTANVALLFILLLRLTHSLWPAAFIAALFAWHPLHVESVAWISERKDVLSTFFALLALLSYTKYAQIKLQIQKRKLSDGAIVSPFNPRTLTFNYFLALTFFALGLLSKPMIVTLPFVMLLLDFWPLQRCHSLALKNLLVEKIPFFFLTAASCLVTFIAQQNGDSVAPLAKISFAYRLENALVALLHYLAKLFWPVDLSVIYPLAEKIPAVSILAAALILFFISWLAWRARRTKPFFIIGWLWFLGTLVPVIGLVQVGSQSFADRYTYFPAIGFFLALVFLARDFVARFHVPKNFVAVISILILAACIFVTERQLCFWRDSETLFRHALDVTKNNEVALVNLGVTLDAQNRFTEALPIYQRALQLAPDSFEIHNNLANIFDRLDRPVDAVREYRAALTLHPNDPVLHNNLGMLLAANGQRDLALQEFSIASQLDPNYSWPRVQTARTLLQMGRDAEAVENFRAALKIDPDNFQILAQFAHVLAADSDPKIRDGQLAFILAAKANQLTQSTQPFVLDALGMACAEVGKFDDAQVAEQQALADANFLQMKKIEPFQQRLQLFKNHQPWRESFAVTNLPPKNFKLNF